MNLLKLLLIALLGATEWVSLVFEYPLEQVMKTLNELILEGMPISDPTARSGDLDFLLDEERADGAVDFRTRIWVEVDVSVQLFGCSFTMEELGPWMCDPLELKREREREAAILAWVEAKGGWQEALKESPVLATARRNRLALADGWHRIKLARQSGQTSVRALVGVRRLRYIRLVNQLSDRR